MKQYTLLKNKKIKEQFIDKLEVTLSCVILLFLWQIIALKINNDIFLPTINQVFDSIKEIVLNSNFYIDILYSIGRCFFSFLFALIFAIILSIIAYLSRIFRNLLKPINALARSIPTMILVVLALIWFEKDSTPFIVGFAIVFPILYDSVLGAILNIDKNLLEMASVYKIRFIDKVLKIYLLAIKFQIISILVSTFSLSLKVAIAGEVYSQPTYGIGTMIQTEKINFNTSGIFAWIIIIVLISAILQVAQKFLSRRAFLWKR
ncbi:MULTISPECIES: ABC transporter permease subunit [unclassified Clostridioides]|uniref:ABC transporter permease n=1 Tax=unclassified Clostridioides TaxID=2635829 RepID=UPI001D122388|nr:ABC transporter permease subunit [Clostridioides sp. ZZV14-6153]MCC0728246.1 ABC transporter permease subunit [Clostridioides sp. ZZV14-6045]MCC0732188.1 ABC transporter permease subunit [Clostridioides sp. ZZV14-6048]MCC0736367.1 ABC transporter permease subunit [Clostridioides sp. ZZV14-6009]MCC0740045.1 ABC transporter permease subunit [Clostridioides sp. ZZV14-5902]